MATLDAMKAASEWVPQADGEYDTGEPLDLDSRGWVRSLPGPGSPQRYRWVVANVLHDNPAAPGSTRYVVLYRGRGTIEGTVGTTVVESQPGRLVVTSAPTGELYLKITETDPERRGDYIRDIRIVREDCLPLFEAGLTFTPAFLARIEDFHALRFMDWMSSNHVFDRAGRPIEGDDRVARAELVDWRHRPRPDDKSWAMGTRGLPAEAMVEIANRVGADPWFNMPINASDDYIRGFATYVRDHLRPDLKVRVELSNEVWNWSFPQARYAEARARATFGPDANWMEWYGKRTAEVGRIWNEVFGELTLPAGDPGRVLVVYDTQFAWKGLETHGLETEHWRDAQGRPVRAADHFDEYAITGYYDLDIQADDPSATVMRWWKDPDGGHRRAIDALRRTVVERNAEFYRYHASIAKKNGLRLITYESGFSEITPISQHRNQAYTDFLISLQRRPELYELETANFRSFRNAGGALFMNYGIISQPSKWGSWSALESVTQTTSPRYRALIDWVRGNPPWQGTGRSPETFGNARYHVAGDGGETLVGSAHGHDVLVGGRGDDLFVPKGARDSRFDGRAGTDVLHLAGPRAHYRFANKPGSVITASGPDGTMWLRNIELVRFGAAPPIPLSADEALAN